MHEIVQNYFELWIKQITNGAWIMFYVVLQVATIE